MKLSTAMLCTIASRSTHASFLPPEMMDTADGGPRGLAAGRGAFELRRQVEGAPIHIHSTEGEP